MQHMKESVQELVGKGLKPLFDIAQEGLGKFAAWLASAPVQDWANKAANALKDFGSAIGGAFGWLADHGDLVKSVLIGMAAALGALLISLIPTIPAMWATVAAAWAMTVPLLPLYALILAIGVLVAVVAYAWQHNFGDIQGKTQAVWEFIQPIFNTIKDWFVTHIPGALETAKAVFAVFWSIVTAAFWLWLSVVITVVGGVIGFVQSIGPAFSAVGTTVHNILTTIGGFFSGLGTTVSTTIDNVVSYFKGLPQRIKDAIGDATTMLKGIGTDIVNGLKTGISDAWWKVTSKIKELTDKIPQAIRDLLGISSPSKVFAIIGRQMALGIPEGFAAALPAVQASLRRLETPAIALSPRLLTPAMVAASTGAAGNVAGGGSSDEMLGLLRDLVQTNNQLVRINQHQAGLLDAINSDTPRGGMAAVRATG
jgi:phage-related protein